MWDSTVRKVNEYVILICFLSFCEMQWGHSCASRETGSAGKAGEAGSAGKVGKARDLMVMLAI